LPGNSEDHYPEDHQARYIEAAVQGVLVTSIYQWEPAAWTEIQLHVAPRRNIVKTKDHPDEKFIRHLMGTFWPVLIYLLLGSGIVVRMFGSIRGASIRS
jgi:hypothetical protein